MTFHSIDPEVWKPEADGDLIEGYYLARMKEVGEYKSKAYKFETTDGKKVVIFGNSVLDDKMQFVKIGDLVRIIFRGLGGEESGGKKKYKIYEVQVDDGKTEE